MPDEVLVISPNWLGDAVMAMPALKAFKTARPATRVCVLAKKSVAPLWEMHDSVSEIIVLERGNAATFAAAAALRERAFDAAYILPNSFRSALIPFLARIKKRRGARGKWRRLMLNDTVALTGLRHAHQSLEYARIMLGENAPLADTGFHPDTTAAAAARREIILIPGAARGDSKRWPYFAELAKLILAAHPETRFLICGSVSESELCHDLAEKIGPPARSMAGATTLQEFATLLSTARLVICNDSGGMHLASAAGTPVLAIYGLTDPDKTGPIGTNAIIIRPENVTPSRDIPRDSPAAAAALRSITPETALAGLKKSNAL